MAPPVRLQGVDEELQKLLDANKDEAPARRRAREAFKDIQLGIDHILFKVLAFEGFGLILIVMGNLNAWVSMIWTIGFGVVYLY